MRRLEGREEEEEVAELAVKSLWGEEADEMEGL